jgi:hypothetical protein
MAVNNGLIISNVASVEVFRRGETGLKVSTSRGRIYIPNNNTAGLPWSEDYSELNSAVSSFDRAIFIHELVHVYQQKTLGWDIAKLGYESILAGNDYCYVPLTEGKQYFQYNQEEQAEIVSDRYLLNNSLTAKLLCNRGATLPELNGVIDL